MNALMAILAAGVSALAVWYACESRASSPAPHAGVGVGLTGPLARLAELPLVAELKRGREAEAVSDTCLEEVPEMLDILTLGLSAGLSFDASLSLYCERYDTPLASLMDLTRLSWTMGVASRAEALAAMARQVGASALEHFSSAVSESLAFGVPLVETLVHQASAIRADHKRDVEEAIEKVPVKMLVPLGTLVVPAMLLAVLGPLVAAALGSVG